jgi:hypothetical protein
MIKESIEYKLISAHYGNCFAKRSRVPLINHINEGLTILDSIGATNESKRAFCLHPLLQHDFDLDQNYYMVSNSCDAKVVMFAMEYRSVANEFLSDKINSGNEIRLSPLYHVNDMLAADKVQNYKDFLTYHCGTHPRSDELNRYFIKWPKRLGITDEDYQRLSTIIDNSKVTT